MLSADVNEMQLKAQIELQDDVAYSTTAAPDFVVCRLFS